MTGHLGARVSALLDGQLSAQDTERAWDHVHACHFCRDQVEREGWVKTRLAGLSFDAGPGPAPDTLKGALLGMPQPWETSWSAPPPRTRSTRRVAGLAAIGGGAAGAAVMGVLALGTAPADVPSFERRTPTQVSTPSPTPAPRLDNRLDPRLYTRMGR